MRQAIKRFWEKVKEFFLYWKFLFLDEDPNWLGETFEKNIEKETQKFLDIEFKEDPTMPPDEVHLVGKDEKHSAKIVGIGIDPSVTEGSRTLLWQYIEDGKDAEILSITMWTEGSKCEHSYRRVETSKEHSKSVTASGSHKDYICTKCGHSLCSIVSPGVKNFINEWEATISEK